MGIPENKFGIIWRAIEFWRRKKGLSTAALIYSQGYTEYRIKKGIKDGAEWLTSEFVRNCFEVFGLSNARQRGPEDTAEILTDEEIIAALIAPLTEVAKQGTFWV